MADLQPIAIKGKGPEIRECGRRGFQSIMSRTKRLTAIVGILVLTVTVSLLITVWGLYGSARDRYAEHLLEIARLEARHLEAVAEIDGTSLREMPINALAPGLSPITREDGPWPTETSRELYVARRSGESIEWLRARNGHADDSERDSDPELPIGISMHRALEGESGTLTGANRRGRTVLTAYEPAGESALGVVVASEMSVFRNSFFRAARDILLLTPFVIAGGVAFILMEVVPGSSRLKTLHRRDAHAESVESFDRLIDAVPHMVWSACPDGSAASFNRKWCEYTGLTLAESKADGWQVTLHPEDRESCRRAWKRSVDDGTPYELESRYRRACDGEYRWHLVRAVPVLDDHGHIERWVGTCTDVEERNLLESGLRDSEQRLRMLLTHVPTAIAMFDMSLRYICHSRRWPRVFRLPSDGLIGTGLFDTFPDAPRRWKAVYAAGLEEKYQSCEEVLWQHPDGTEEWINWRVGPWTRADGSLGGLIMGAEIITKRKRAERRIQALNSKLEAQIEKRTAELLRSNEELEQFAYAASHDLQEPLRKMSNYAELLQRRYRGQLDEKADRFIHYIVDGAKRMSRLIRDLLEYSRLGREELPRSSFPLEKALRTVLSDLESLIEEKNAEVTHGPLPVILANKHQLCLVLQNLIGNAIKFCNRAPPRIHVHAEREGNRWRVKVRDNGIGIESAQQERIFNAFQRLHLRSEYPGTGIGLAVCKKIIERHGGKIWVESEPGCGSTFCFEIEATEVSIRGARSSHEAPAATPNLAP